MNQIAKKYFLAPLASALKGIVEWWVFIVYYFFGVFFLETLVCWPPDSTTGLVAWYMRNQPYCTIYNKQVTLSFIDSFGKYSFLAGLLYMGTPIQVSLRG